MQMSRWASEGGPGAAHRPPATGPATQPAGSPLLRLARSEAIALQGSAEVADHRYDDAAAIDVNIAGQAMEHADATVGSAAIHAIRRAQRGAEAVRLMDDAIALQYRLMTETVITGLSGGVAVGGSVVAIAGQQRAIATRIGQIAAHYWPVGPSGLPGTFTDGNARYRVAMVDAALPDEAVYSRLPPAARYAIEAAQAELARVQHDLADLDPLAAAMWLARASAGALAHGPRDLQVAMRLQAESRNALVVARRRAIRYSMIQRLTAVRLLRTGSAPATLVDAPAASPGAAAAAGTGRVGPFSGFGAILRDWRRLRPGEQDDPAALLLEQDVPGYGPAIKAYFEALGKMPAASPGG